MASKATPKPQPARSSPGQILSLPPRWLAMYDDFIAKNAGQVSQIESTLRSLTYIIPGRFRDAEIASESIHSLVQLLSLYHDTLLRRFASSANIPSTPLPSAHTRYTRFWTGKSKLYRRVAMVLQMVVYTELLWEMTAKRRGGEKRRWTVVCVLEAIKAVCRLLLLRITRSRPVMGPPLPEREPLPEGALDEDEEDLAASESELMDEVSSSPSARPFDPLGDKPRVPAHEKNWTMPRTGMSLPSLPKGGDITSYLLGRVLTADDVKPATKLLNRLQGQTQAAEILHILTPLIYVALLARASLGAGSADRTSSGRSKRFHSSWTPWLVGVALELTARQLRERSFKVTTLEREEWTRRGWAMGWWAMRGAFYDRVTQGVVKGVSSRMPGFMGAIVDDYAYLWENYYFSTSR